jgi:hypothetical protein
MRKLVLVAAIAGGLLAGIPQQVGAMAQCNHGRHTHPHGSHTHRWSWVSHRNEDQWHVERMHESTHDDTDEAYC